MKLQTLTHKKQIYALKIVIVARQNKLFEFEMWHLKSQFTIIYSFIFLIASSLFPK